MKVQDYIKSVQNDRTQVLLFNRETSQIWGVDSSALRDRGYPDGGWCLLEDVSKEELVALLYKARGIDGIDD